MTLRWVAANMIEANKGFPRSKAHKQLPALRSRRTTPAHLHSLVAHITRARATFNPASAAPLSSIKSRTSPVFAA